ncbi:hypothetical protein ACQY0O_000222 [Thecaphora frezii]
MTFQSWPQSQSLSQSLSQPLSQVAMTPPASSQLGNSGASRLSTVAGRSAHSVFSRAAQRRAQAGSFLSRHIATPSLAPSSDTLTCCDAASISSSQQCSRLTPAACRHRPLTAPDSVQQPSGLYYEQHECLMSLQNAVAGIETQLHLREEERKQSEVAYSAQKQTRENRLETLTDHQQQLREELASRFDELAASIQGLMGRIQSISDRQDELQKAGKQCQDECRDLLDQKLRELQEANEVRHEAVDQRQHGIEKELGQIGSLLSDLSLVLKNPTVRETPTAAPAPAPSILSFGGNTCLVVTPELFDQLLDQRFEERAEAWLQKRQGSIIEDQVAGGDGAGGAAATFVPATPRRL